MNKIQIANLEEIIKCKYSNIALNYTDISHFTRLPQYKRNYYPIKYRSNYAHMGFFNNGQTLIWANWQIDGGHLKIALNNNVNNLESDWTDTMSFQEEGSPLKIYKLIKLKAFW